jgi:uncharacterized protein YbcI
MSVFLVFRVRPFPGGRRERRLSMTDSPSELQQGSQAAAISNLVVRLVREYTGRGPTQARTHITEDLVSVVLRDTLTKGEISLVRDGRAELVLSMRKAFQDTMRADLVAGVEAVTGREVDAFMSDNHLDPDVAVESFVLKPVASGADQLPDQPGRA